MIMEETYTQKLQQQIKGLEDSFDVQALELTVMKNELIENSEVSILVSTLTQHILQMLMEYMDFIKGRTESDSHKKSRKRLVEILDISGRLMNIDTNNQSLKLYNRELAGKIHSLRIVNSELRDELEKINKSINF